MKSVRAPHGHWLALLGAGSAIVGLVATAACSSDYSTTTTDAGDSDAAPSPPIDGSSFVPQSIDAGDTDAPPRVDFCDLDAGSSTLECASFDRGTAFPPMWVADQKKIGTLQVDSKDARSLPNSLIASVPAQTTGDAYQELGISAPQGTGSFAIDLDFLLSFDATATGSNGNTAFVCFVEITADNGENAQICFGKLYFGATIETYDDDAGVSGSAHVNLNGAPPQLDTWHHLRAYYSFLASGGSISVELDGAGLGATTPARTLHLGSVGTGNVFVEVGASSTGQVGAVSVRVDNVRLSSR